MNGQVVSGQLQPGTYTFGPYNLATQTTVGGDGSPLVSVPYATMKNASAFVSLSDNINQALSALAQPGAGVPNFTYTNIGAEIVVVGEAKGFSDVLKRQFVRSIWGAGMVFNLRREHVFEHIIFRARLLYGGKPSQPLNMVFVNQTTTPLIVNAQVILAVR
jgi:hypothetical protein